mmetsp:Transcript_13960/g.37253  ORF Transcript_13960/g.37253 Transcript_13960/m.37253 type:complete len:99 (+) Transcript_13960:112-408(+)
MVLMDMRPLQLRSTKATMMLMFICFVLSLAARVESDAPVSLPAMSSAPQLKISDVLGSEKAKRIEEELAALPPFPDKHTQHHHGGPPHLELQDLHLDG